MTYEIRNVRTNELIAGPYTVLSSATRSFKSRLLTPEQAYIADLNWRDRERARKNLINVEQFGVLPIPDHFLHVSSKSNGENFLVSYTENNLKGEKNLQKSGQRVGRYLEEFYKNLGSTKIAEIGAAIQAKYDTGGFRIAMTSEDIERVYTRSEREGSASSCMSHGRDSYLPCARYSVDVHPTSIYGAGDVGVAYIESEKGRIQARCLVWPEKKIYVSFYGSGADKLRQMLNQAGYRSGSLSGARVKKIPVKASDRSGMSFVATYMDEGSSFYLNPSDPDYMILGRGLDSKYGPSGTGSSNGLITFPIYTSVFSNQIITGTAVIIYNPANGDRVGYADKTELTDDKAWFWKDGNSWFVITGYESYYVNMRGFYARYSNEPVDMRVPRYIAEGHYGWVNPIDLPKDEFRDPKTLMSVGNYRYATQSGFFKDYGFCERTRTAYRRSELIWMEHQAWWHRNYAHEVTVIDGKNYATVLISEKAA